MCNPVYSIIIPHKNCPNLLNRCLSSIPKRKDIQIIVVDDNSDGGKKPIINRDDVETVLLDSSLAGGAGRARNVGLARATGKWLLFADADDYYNDYFPLFLDKYANDESTDIVYFNANMIDDKGVEKSLIMERLINNYIRGYYYSEMDLRFGSWSIWSRMIKRVMVENNSIQFEESPIGNDIMFGLKSSACAKIISVDKEIVYHYYKWPNGSITENRGLLLLEDRLMIRGERIAFYNKVNFHTSVNLFSLIEYFYRSRKLTADKARTLYFQCLKHNHIPFLKDITCYIYELLIKRIPAKITSLSN